MLIHQDLMLATVAQRRELLLREQRADRLSAARAARVAERAVRRPRRLLARLILAAR